MKKILADTLRFLSAQMIETARSGHPGMPLGFADSMVALLGELNFDPSDPNWINRDRIIFSCGHGCALWYSVLYGFGLLSKDQLSSFRQLDSSLPGHPEIMPGVDMSTGPLGQGFAWSVGFALAERVLFHKYDGAIDHYTFVICSDGDLMEGVSYESAALAGHYGLNRLIALWDDNSITIDGPVEQSSSEDTKLRFVAAGWDIISVDGHNIEEVENAIRLAKKNTKPTLIACKTIIGKYSVLAGSNKVHGSPLGKENFQKLMENLNYDEDVFLKEFQKMIQKNAAKKKEWEKKFGNLDFSISLNLEKTEELASKLRGSLATRKHSEFILESLLENNNNIIIATADLGSSCGTLPKNGTLISHQDYTGNLLACGVREHAMVAITGGLSLHGGLFGVCSSFLSFYDYARPAIRLAALMRVPFLMIATHDSIAVGEDGPTHQPVEHLDSLRCIPNLLVARPADGFETFYCYKKIFESLGPAILSLSRHNLSNLHENFIEDDDLWLIRSQKKELVVSCGSECFLSFESAKALGYSMLSCPIWDHDGIAIREKCKDKNIFVIEASRCFAWKYALNCNVFAMHEFGKSGKECDVLKFFGFSSEKVISWLQSFL